MAFRLTAPSHYLYQCWLTIAEILWHIFHGNVYLNTQNTNPVLCFKFVNMFKITATCTRVQCVEISAFHRILWETLIHAWNMCLLHTSQQIHRAWIYNYSPLFSLGCHYQHIEAETKWPPFLDDILKCIFLSKNAWIAIKISRKFVPKGLINNIPALVQIMAWRRPGDKPLSEPMMVSLLTYMCVICPQRVKAVLTKTKHSGMAEASESIGLENTSFPR